MEYTVEIFKQDARTKSDQRMFKKFDITVTSPRAAVQLHYESVYPAHRGYKVVLHDTFVISKNLITGAEFTERYDTPYFCSPSSETFWTM
jgi:elongation factor P hydroxylase